MFGSKFLPFFAVPLMYYAYEAIEYKQNESKEISKEFCYMMLIIER